MTILDWILVALIAVSALFGLARGAVREVAGTLALALGAAAALMLGPRFSSLFSFIPWPAAARWAAIISVFLGVFIVVRLLGAVIASGVRLTPLSGLDRIAGAGIGAGRGAIFCALLALGLASVFPLGHRPLWVSHSRFFPLAARTGQALGHLAPNRRIDTAALAYSPETSDTPISGPSQTAARRSLAVHVETKR